MSREFEFKMRVTACDREGYYYPRWDQARTVTAIATTEQQAINDVAAALGPCRDGRNWYWGFKVDAMKAVTP
ncbi:hypothetical protein [Nocardioides aurantiacus]|uniref:Uncharacterized protein n=1 Tax=Nocardioides aurantiacus TaxID=86796 RepID=A0A3N2CW00_9ACTN|nr:hypothetical protein [Nocardioides aurantiacus]ROR91722.1 hypothetical protein EDD33_2597 [Nocardioides aurantiacus]